MTPLPPVFRSVQSPRSPDLIDLIERNARLKKKLDRLAWVCCIIAALLILVLAWSNL